MPRAHVFIAKLDGGQLFAEWCQQRRLVGLRSYDDSLVVADDHRPVLEPWATPRGLGSGSSLVDGIEVADQNVAVLRAPLPEVIGYDSKLPAWSLLVDEFRHAVTPCAALPPSTSEDPKSALRIGTKTSTRSDRIRAQRALQCWRSSPTINFSFVNILDSSPFLKS